MQQILKYPRTPHIQGSRLQAGDEDLSATPFHEIAGKYLVVEEKMDGANAAISFSEEGELRLQSRGHYLTGGPREKHFALFKTWAHTYALQLYEVLRSRYIMYGEWLYAKHTIFYTDLPHYFLEFDIYDLEEKIFLSTQKREKFLQPLHFVVPVKVLFEGTLQSQKALEALVGPSFFIKSGHMEVLRNLSIKQGLKPDQVIQETDYSINMEGLYIKVEDENKVLERYKWVRHDFLQTALNSGSHWLDRPIIPNQLVEGVDLFG